MEKQKFSVSMCVYEKDNPEWFRVAVESILNQTCKPDEVVLVVDGPVGEPLKKVILEYDRLECFKVIWLPENKGLGNARRVGVDACVNELIAMMDSDDISVLDRFEKQLRLFEIDAELDIAGGLISEFIGEPKNVVAKRIVPTTDAEIKEYLKTRCPMNHMTVMCKKASLGQVGGYVDWHYNEDYYLWIRMVMANMKFANIPEVLVNVRIGKEMYQRRGGLRYFRSEAKLQKYMLDHKIIDFGTFLVNVGKRLIVQVLLPNRIRGWVFQKFARKAA